MTVLRTKMVFLKGSNYITCNSSDSAHVNVSMRIFKNRHFSQFVWGHLKFLIKKPSSHPSAKSNRLVYFVYKIKKYLINYDTWKEATSAVAGFHAGPRYPGRIRILRC